MEIYSMYDVIEWLKKQPKEMDDAIINFLIEQNELEKQRIKKRINRFIGESTGFNDENRVNNPLNKVNYKTRFSFWNKIIFEKMGYMSNPVTITLNKNSDKYKNNERLFNFHNEVLKDYIKYTKTHDKNNEIMENASILGYSYKYLYIDKNRKVQTKILNGDEVIIIKDEQDLDINFALRYYSIQKDNVTSYYKVEWYTDSMIYYFEETEKGKYTLIKQQPHGFSKIPIVEIKNNYKRLGDCELLIKGKVFDTYDFTYSDLLSEFAQLRLAYLFLKNVKPTPEMLEAAKQTGIFGFKGDDVDMKFLTKDIDSAPVLNILSDLESKIYYLSNAANITDDNFGNLSGVAAQYKLFYLEMKANQLKNQLFSMLEDELDLFLNFIKVLGINIDKEDIQLEMQFNKVINYKEEAETAIIEQGILDERTILANMSKVKDVDEVINNKKEDAKNSIIDAITTDDIKKIYGNVDAE